MTKEFGGMPAVLAHKRTSHQASQDGSDSDTPNINNTHRLVSDTEGELKQLLLFAPAYETKDFELIYTSLIQQLPTATELTVVTVPEARQSIEHWASSIPDSTISVLPVSMDISPWARDPFWVINTGKGSDANITLYSSPSLDRRDDGKIATILADKFAYSHQPFVAPFEGGNSLISEKTLFIGSDTLLAQKGANLDDKRVSFLKALSDSGLHGYRLVVVGDPEQKLSGQVSNKIHLANQQWEEITFYASKAGTTQPIFHIDYYVTPLPNSENDHPRIMVGDSRFAAQLLGHKLHPAAQADQLDAVAAQLSKLGFEVIRNPLPFIYMDEIEKHRRVRFFASSNNVLQQASSISGNIVWMPQFGHDNWLELKVTDEANARLWRSLGYEVRFIPDCQRLAENLGGLHCLTSVLKRS